MDGPDGGSRGQIPWLYQFFFYMWITRFLNSSHFGSVKTGLNQNLLLFSTIAGDLVCMPPDLLIKDVPWQATELLITEM